jgi:hypothetical protein
MPALPMSSWLGARTWRAFDRCRPSGAVATWIEVGTRDLAAPSVKQRARTAIRHLFDWLVTGQVPGRVARRQLHQAPPQPGDRGFESLSLQRRVGLWRDFIFMGKNPGFPRGFLGCVPGAVGREPQGPPTARQPWVISLSGHIPVPRFRRCGRDKSLG